MEVNIRVAEYLYPVEEKVLEVEFALYDPSGSRHTATGHIPLKELAEALWEPLWGPKPTS